MRTIEQGDEILAKHLQTLEEELEELTRRVKSQSAKPDPQNCYNAVVRNHGAKKNNDMKPIQRKLDSIGDALQTLTKEQEQEEEEALDPNGTEGPPTYRIKRDTNRGSCPKKQPNGVE